MYVLGTAHRSCECKSSYVRDASAIAAWVKGTGLVFFLCSVLSMHRRPGWKPPITAASSTSFREPHGSNQKSNSYWRDSAAIDAAPISRASADCRAARSITGLTGCNPTCIYAPAASPRQWVDAQESSSATGIPHVACRAGVRPTTSHPILQCSQTPTGGELRGDHHRQRDDQKASNYCFWHSNILFGA